MEGKYTLTLRCTATKERFGLRIVTNSFTLRAFGAFVLKKHYEIDSSFTMPIARRLGVAEDALQLGTIAGTNGLGKTIQITAVALQHL